MSAIDPFSDMAPVSIPPADLALAPTTARVAFTTNVEDPGTGLNLIIAAADDGVDLSAPTVGVALLMGQTDPAENGFWQPVGSGVGAHAERVVSAGIFADHLGPGGEDRHYQQFKASVTAGSFAGKTYFMATPAPALFEDGLEFMEVTAQSPSVPSNQLDDTAPGGTSNGFTPAFSNSAPAAATGGRTTAFSNSAPGQHS